MDQLLFGAASPTCGATLAAVATVATGATDATITACGFTTDATVATRGAATGATGASRGVATRGGATGATRGVATGATRGVPTGVAGVTTVTAFSVTTLGLGVAAFSFAAVTTVASLRVAAVTALGLGVAAGTAATAVTAGTAVTAVSVAGTILGMHRRWQVGDSPRSQHSRRAQQGYQKLVHWRTPSCIQPSSGSPEDRRPFSGAALRARAWDSPKAGRPHARLCHSLAPRSLSKPYRKAYVGTPIMAESP
jgi:hypothetical protein